MAVTVTIEELKRMGPVDLRREILRAQALIAKMRLHVRMSKEKDTALYRREKKQLARMLTVLGQLTGGTLKKGGKQDSIATLAEKKLTKRTRKFSSGSSS